MNILLITVALGAGLLSGPSVAQHHGSDPHAKDQITDPHREPVPPTHVVIDPPLPTSDSPKPEPDQTQKRPAENLTPEWRKPEWVTVYVTADYALIAWFTLIAIKRQAKTMEEQAKDFRDVAKSSAETTALTLAAIKRQADIMEKQHESMRDRERARLSVEFVSLQFDENPSLIFKVISHGPTPALITGAEMAIEFLPLEDFEWREHPSINFQLPRFLPESEELIKTFIARGDPQSHHQIAAADTLLHFRVRVRYDDVFGASHETRIARVYGGRLGHPEYIPFFGLLDDLTSRQWWRKSEKAEDVAT